MITLELDNKAPIKFMTLLTIGLLIAILIIPVTMFNTIIIIITFIVALVIFFSNISKINKYRNRIYDSYKERELLKAELKNQSYEIDKIKSELDKIVYSLSHDIRSPLLSTLGLINISRIETDDATKDKYYSLMEKSVKKLDNHIQDIIHLSANSHSDIKTESINILEEVSEVIIMLKNEINFNDVSITHNISINDKIFSDKARLKIIILNIISNSLKYANIKEGKPSINIKLDIDNDYFTLEIADNGIGIPKESQSKIFNMYYRATDTNHGSGLGLYIVREIIDKLDGEIFVKSELYKGTSILI